MFTGLVQRVGRFRGLRIRDGGHALSCSHEPWDTPLEIGESVAVQGVCLTVTEAKPGEFAADVLDETLDKTALGGVVVKGRVNLERALRLSDRLGGHIVTGHIDECGTIAAITNRGRDRVLRVSCSAALARQTVLKGSIAIDGISLTVSGVGHDWLEVNIIPHTWEATSLIERRPGDAVNLEGDILAKYVERLCGSSKGGVTEELLVKAGFVV
ncbi:MAG: riboflavin synthase [Lentisphaerae bacterium]|jgi:riboflavin synthase|nr:riboflavin synthase [Lentisphaerota bacterium]